MSEKLIITFATLDAPSPGNTYYCRGEWTLAGIAILSLAFKKFKSPSADVIVLDGQNILQMDSAGALLINHIEDSFKANGVTVELQGFAEKHDALVKLVHKTSEEMTALQHEHIDRNLFYQIGEGLIRKLETIYESLGFVGELTVRRLHALSFPSAIKWRAILVAIEESGYHALPIVALLQFLVGIVLSYQMGLQLRYYGADLFIVNVTGHSILREFGPLITGIIAAGRTSSAYTAQIGTMKVNEEIDALTTMGLSSIDWLVLPKIIGTLIALPLLTAWADAFGMFGAMFMSKISLGLSYSDFITRFEEVVPLKTYMIGLIKAPVFAVIVAITGCFQGFRVGYNAESVGHQTTVSVVQAIFLLIVADSIFSIYFNWAGI